MNDSAAIESPPQLLDEAEYNECIDILKPTHLEANVIDSYQKSAANGSYVLTSSAQYVDHPEWWSICRATLMSKWHNAAAVHLVGFYFFLHRMKCGRKGDALDDHQKARYLVDLVNYLNPRRPSGSIIHLRWDYEMEEIIEEVNTIFDTAYFRKIQQPWRSDFDCFLEAEREFCAEKDIDFLLYQQRLEDRSTAEKRHVEQEIRALALQNYEWRLSTGVEGSAIDDWVNAEQQYPEWRMKKRIAVIYWNISESKQQPQDHYWWRACQAVAELKKRGIGCDANPYDLGVFKIILEVFNDPTASKP